MQRLSRIAAAIAAALIMCGTLLPAQAQGAGTTIVGTLIDAGNGVPIPGAAVDLFQGDQRIAGGVSDSAGVVTFVGEPPGVYHLEIRAEGYGSGRSDDVVVNPGAARATMRATLQRESTSTGNAYRQIGRVSSSVQRAQLQTTSTITQSISAERLQRENYVRVGDALYVLPGVNLGSQDSAVGDDLTLNIRGIGATESAVLLDGHPIGPFGAGGSSFNLQLTPFWALRNVDVVYGSGAQGVYGIDAIAGAIDLQTINPTRTPQSLFHQGFGTQGRTESVVQATGTVNNRLGYAFSSSVQGTYGAFTPGNRLQSGFLAQDQSDAGIASAGALYSVSANYLLRDNLAKLTYQFSPQTSASLQYYESSSMDDKTGNGDNDAFSPAFTFSQLFAPGGLLNGATGTQIPAPDGSTPCAPVGSNSVASIPVFTNKGNVCVTPSQYALSTTGPEGGGGNRFQWDGLRDAVVRLNHRAGRHNFTAFAYTDSYQIDTTRFPKTQSSRDVTFGLQLSDDIVTDNNDFGFGFFSPHQRETSDQTIKGAIVQGPDLGQSTANYFLRDTLQVNPKLAIFANAWFKQSSVTHNTTFDPRLSVVFRPTDRDAIRITAARADAVPDIGLTQGATSFSNPGSVNVNCAALTNIGSIQSPSLLPENAKDLEVTFGHRFAGDSQVQVALYETNVTNKIINTAVTLSSLPQFENDPGFQSQLAGYLAKFNTECFSGRPVLQNAQQLAALTSVTGALNAASGQFKGIEVSGRARVNRHVFFDYAYDIQSARLLGLADSSLAKAPNLNNGSQIGGIPLQKLSLGLDVADGHGFEVRLDGFYVGNNNGYNRPAYTFFNGGVSKAFRYGTTVTIGVQNIFNSASQQYGLVGEGVYQPINPVAAAQQNAAAAAGNGSAVPTTGLGQGSEAFGLAPRSILFAVSQRVGAR